MNIITLILFIAGFVLLVVGAEILVKGASQLALVAGVSPLVIGLTIVAYCTSAPELAVALQSSYDGQADIALGNIVGSNIANILLILGISATMLPLVVSRQLVRLDVPLMIGISFLLLFMSLDGQLGRVDGSILLAGAIAYTLFTIIQSRKENQEIRDQDTPQTKYRQSRTSLKKIVTQLGLIVFGLGMLVLGSRWLINGAIALAKMFGWSELIIGLTIIAVGTSLPEIATSIIASIRGERDLAVGNAIGSNIFNILLVLGMCSLIVPDGVQVSTPALNFDIPVMIAVAVACLPIFFTGYQISRWEGFLFLSYYGAYTLYLFLNATQHQALSQFSTIMMTFVVPLTIVTLVILVMGSIRTTIKSG
ncbi:calcium/sodium antiporter [Moorena producens JHB]|uniref:Calcium/sodium antiporter n=1 Tax=Moorena producens (strain JHB) TaxID=1454205 RepID=A0A1D9FTJ6_MOOP1|nr:calcium/sodium antiporter [Moorena producens]AOY78691.1 calcium/sodium antiporter [Moorena producens JHB]